MTRDAMHETLRYTLLDSPIGELEIVSDDQGLRSIFSRAHRHRTERPKQWQRDDAGLRDAREQLSAYFAGELRVFTLPLHPRGTPFQRSVWKVLEAIPYGTTTTYGAIARTLGDPNACRAVGAANGRNPISVVVPCHRVIGQDGSLTGYAGGLAMKRALLELEQGKVAATLW